MTSGQYAEYFEAQDYDFIFEHSGQNWNDTARLVNLDDDDPYYQLVEKTFENNWEHTNKPMPSVYAVYRILTPEYNLATYKAYRARVAEDISEPCSPNQGNEELLFHGTDRFCRIGESPSELCLCDLPYCRLCSIIRYSFDVNTSGEKHTFRRFGKGIYTSSCSSKADDYSCTTTAQGDEMEVMLVCRVVVGRPWIREHDAPELTKAPWGYHSVIGVPGGRLNYPETIVYDNDAIRPAFLVMYGSFEEDSEEDSEEDLEEGSEEGSEEEDSEED